MSRTKEYLISEANSLGIELIGNEHTADIMNLIRDIKLDGQDLIKDQISPMNAKDTKEFFSDDAVVPWSSSSMHANVWNNRNLIAETKFDEIRLKAHLVGGGQYRFDSRGRSDVSYEYSELTANLPQFQQISYDSHFKDTILDGELLMPVDTVDTGAVVTQGTLTTTMAVTGSGPEKAIPLQRKYGWARLHVFDVIKLAGVWMTDKTWLERRILLEKIAQKLDNPYLDISVVFTDNPQTHARLLDAGVATIELVPSLLEKFENVVNEGLEGLMFKEIDGMYEIGKRSKTWRKLKRFESVEGFIIGSIPGSNAWEGLVGALRVAAYLPSGDLFEFAAVSGFDLELRKQMTAEDGSLLQDYLGLVVEIRGQERGKNRRYRHAILYRWRPDRTSESCYIDA